jgi:hypothetical protein
LHVKSEPGSLVKKEEEDATVCFIKDGTFVPLLLSEEPGTGGRKLNLYQAFKMSYASSSCTVL